LAKKKLIHFAENLTFRHLIQKSYADLQEGFNLKGNWQRDYFGNRNPITLELGCGKGEYTVHLAQRYPERNFLGIDIKGARLWKGCKMVAELSLPNVAFIRSRIDWIGFLFGEDEIDEIWITFPDPQPQSGRVNKRLTSPFFLEKYREVVRPGGLIHLKTDNQNFYKYTLGVISKGGHKMVHSSNDIYQTDPDHEACWVQTFYEEKYRREGVPIKYCSFVLHDGH
jgi:tRNA (guanine-N7-)-methyltransferase